MPQLLRGLVLLGAVQVRRRLDPAVPPGANGQAGQAHLLSHGRDAGIGCQGEDDRDAADQPLVGGLLSPEALQQVVLDRRNLESRRTWSSSLLHSLRKHLGDSLRTNSIGPTPILVSLFCHLVTSPAAGVSARLRLEPPCPASAMGERETAFNAVRARPRGAGSRVSWPDIRAVVILVIP